MVTQVINIYVERSWLCRPSCVIYVEALGNTGRGASCSSTAKRERACWECGHCTVSWTWQGRFLLVRVLSKQPCVAHRTFMMSVIWIFLARQSTLSETVLIWQLQPALEMHNPVFSPCRVHLLLRTQRYYADLHHPLLCPWDLVADQLRVSGETVVGMDSNKRARLSSVLNLVTLPKPSIDLVCPIWSISRIAVTFNVGADF